MQTFAADLRALRRRSGTPDFASISRATGVPVEALAAAVAGRQLPEWATVAAFVHGCGGLPAQWRERWEQARDSTRVHIPTPRLPS
ncbi:hypothetical protein ACTG9Q_03725 [Actinokineospora sp. 24-640]